MHATLRDAYSIRAKVSEIALFVAASIFAATTFAADELYRFFGVAPEAARIVLGVASIVAFVTSITTMVTDWRGMAAKHAGAFSNFSEALAFFNSTRTADGSWPSEVRAELHRAYWAACANSIPIPESAFVRLKARHKRKVRMSMLLDDFPWCPRFILALALMWKDSRSAWIGIRSAKAD